jgi:UDPglucose 6-dehydrogenase
VAYNCFIGMKLVYANTLMEMAHKIPGCNVNDVIGTIKLATKRLISTAYLTPGLGDGGGCHPRDAIAMSWFAKKIGLMHDIFQDVMVAREDQAKWLCNVVQEARKVVAQAERPESQLPRVVILGKAFKPGTNITTGSCAVLVSNLLSEVGVEHANWDPYVDSSRDWFDDRVFLVATRHKSFRKFRFPKGAVVVDPHRYIPDQDGVTVLRLGEFRKKPALPV